MAIAEAATWRVPRSGFRNRNSVAWLRRCRAASCHSSTTRIWSSGCRNVAQPSPQLVRWSLPQWHTKRHSRTGIAHHRVKDAHRGVSGQFAAIVVLTNASSDFFRSVISMTVPMNRIGRRFGPSSSKNVCPLMMNQPTLSSGNSKLALDLVGHRRHRDLMPFSQLGQPALDLPDEFGQGMRRWSHLCQELGQT